MTIDAWPATDVGSSRPSHELQSKPAQVMLPATGDGLIIWLEQHEDGRVLHLEGALDLAGGAHLGVTIEQLRATDTGLLTVDATALRFVDLSGFRALLACRGALRGTGDRPVLLVGSAVERLRHLVEIAGRGFDRIAPAARDESTLRL